MLVSDVQKVFDWERRWALCGIFTDPFAPVRGLLIGSPAAAGGASLVAAVRETLELNATSFLTRRLFLEYALCRRWMDDLICILRVNAPLEVVRFVQQITRKDFYGKNLVLKRVRTNVGFGFVHTTVGGKVRVRQQLKFQHAEADNEVHAMWGSRSSMTGGPQHRAVHQDRAVVVGYFLRWMDCCNAESRDDMSKGITRLAAELLRVGMDIKVILSALKKVAVKTGQRLRDVELAVLGDRDELFRWCDGYDAEMDQADTAELVKQDDRILALLGDVVL